ncbi:MAG TPA: hypothetical protein VFA11_01445 [Acidimicrobiales bacterium]|nr:hypothetical protein [Acidimicrobiales bacterium]
MTYSGEQNRRVRFGALSGSVLLPALAAAVLLWAGRRLPAPPLLHPRRAAGWLQAVGPPRACFAMVRMAGLAAAGWLGLSALACAAEAVHPRRWTRLLARALTTPALRTSLAAALVPITFSAGTASPAAADTASISAWTGPTGTAAPAGHSPPAVHHLPATATPRPPEPRRPAEEPPAPESPPSPADPGRWVVAPGESFWSIAASVESRRLGRPPSAVETADYWVSLVALNRSRLVVGDDADLIFPGQILQLPGGTGAGQ